MMWFSGLLIQILGTRLYLRIPYRFRRWAGMVRGEDMSDINDLLRELQEIASKSLKAKEEGVGR